MDLKTPTSQPIRNKRLQEQLDKSKARIAELTAAGGGGGGTGGGLNTISEEGGGRTAGKDEKKPPCEFELTAKCYVCS